MMQSSEFESDDSESSGLESLLSAPGNEASNKNATTYNRRVRRSSRRRLVKFLKRQRKAILRLVSKERNTEEKIHDPSPPMQAIRDEEEADSSLRYSLRALIGKELVWCWKRAACIALGYIILVTVFDFETFGFQVEKFTSQYTAVPQFVVASPNVGYIEVIGTTHHLCERSDYTTEDLVLSLNFHHAKISASSISERNERDGGSVLVAKFLIGRKYWKQIVLGSTNATHPLIPTATIVDKRQDVTAEDLPIWVDPSLSFYYGNHALPPSPRAMNTTKKMSKAKRKQIKRRFKETSKNFLGAAVVLRTGSEPETCTLQCLQGRVQEWIQRSRKIGIDQFYILDNHASSAADLRFELPAFDIEGVTYIQTKIAYEDYDCQGYAALPGKALLDTAILKAANVEWLLMMDLDEMVVTQWIPDDDTLDPQHPRFPVFVQSLLDNHQNQSTEPQDNVAALVFSSHLVCENDLTPGGVENLAAVSVSTTAEKLLVKTSMANEANDPNKRLKMDPSSQGWVAKVIHESSPSCDAT